jgi:hypothetical protein
MNINSLIVEDFNPELDKNRSSLGNRNTTVNRTNNYFQAFENEDSEMGEGGSDSG